MLESNVIRFKNGGQPALNRILLCERTLVPFPCLALMDVMLEKSLHFATQRQIRGQRLTSHQHIQRRLTDMAMGVLL